MATDEAWANSVNHYDEDQLAALVSLIALINAYNRMKSSFSGRSSFDNASAVDLPVGGSHGITPCSAAIASFFPTPFTLDYGVLGDTTGLDGGHDCRATGRCGHVVPLLSLATVGMTPCFHHHGRAHARGRPRRGPPCGALKMP